MPYQTGSANDFAALRADISSFLTSNGWTAEGNILKKNGVYALLTADTTNYIQLEGGKGSDGGGNLVDKHEPPSGSYGNNAGRMVGVDTRSTVIWPLTYHLHLSSSPVDEFWCFIEYNGGDCQHMGFGNIVKAAAFDGGGFYVSSWTSGSLPNSVNVKYATFTSITGFTADAHPSKVPFNGVANGWGTDRVDNNFDGCAVHAELPGVSWFSGTSSNYPGYARMTEGLVMYEERRSAMSLINGNVTLVPFRLFGRVHNGNWQRIGRIENLRFTRNDNFNFGQIESDGVDSWKMYPVWAKDSVNRDGGVGHSGTLALAVRYDGS